MYLPTNTNHNRKRKLFLWLLVGIAAILLALFLLDRYLPGRAYNRAKAQVTKELAEITISKVPVFEEAKSGCGVSYGLLVTTHGCSYGGKKLYKGSNNFEADIREIDQTLISLKWTRKGCAGVCKNFEDLFTKGGENNQPLALDGEIHVHYTRGNNELYLYILDSNASKTFNKGELSRDSHITIGSSLEYLYEIDVSEPYISTTTSR
jgi:hypothetical protein